MNSLTRQQDLPLANETFLAPPPPNHSAFGRRRRAGAPAPPEVCCKLSQQVLVLGQNPSFNLLLLVLVFGGFAKCLDRRRSQAPRLTQPTDRFNRCPARRPKDARHRIDRSNASCRGCRRIWAQPKIGLVMLVNQIKSAGDEVVFGVPQQKRAQNAPFFEAPSPISGGF